jgi:uncharacterized protein (TIGR03083 family)
MANDIIGNATAIDETRTSIVAAANHLAAIVRGVRDTSARVPALEWSLAETAVHLSTETREYAQLLRGELDVEEYIRFASGASGPGGRSAILSARQLELNREANADRLATAIEEAAETFVSAAATRRPDDVVRVTNGLTLTADRVSKVILGEHLVHGHDIARAANARWDISRADALKVIDGVVSVTPEYIDPEASRSLKLSFELRFRGGPSYRLDVDHGIATVGPAGGKVDCRITADPVAFLLVGYQRIGQWGQILRGKIRAGGSRPWLAKKFGSLLTPV